MPSVAEMKQELHELTAKAEALIEQAQADNAFDALMMAAQTHRLDMVSTLLAIVAILVGIGSIAGFFEVRSRAGRVAREAAIAECRNIAKDVLREYTDREMPDEVRRSVELFMLTNGFGENDGTDSDQE